jgi:hypothetical protein
MYADVYETVSLFQRSDSRILFKYLKQPLSFCVEIWTAHVFCINEESAW